MSILGRDYTLIDTVVGNIKILSLDKFIEFEARCLGIFGSIYHIRLSNIIDTELLDFRFSKEMITDLYNNLNWLYSSGCPFRLKYIDFDIIGYMVDNDEKIVIEFNTDIIKETFTIYTENMEDFLEKIVFYFLQI